jgi:hypothetical protein
MFGPDDLLNTLPCNSGALSAMAAMAQQTDHPIAPYPLFYSSSQCAGAVSAADFPLYYFPSNCPPVTAEGVSTIPDPTNNCLRVITRASFDPSVLSHTSQINYLPHGKNPIVTSTLSKSGFLISYYIPPQYTIIFFEKDPSIVSPKTQMDKGQVLVQSNNFIMENTCIANLKLANGDNFFTGLENAQTYNELYSACFPQPTDASDPTSAPPLKLGHKAPFFLLIEEEYFSNMIVDMCVSGRNITVGTTSLNTVWHPQTSGCDKFITSLCAMSGVEKTEYAPLCSCFTQQAALDKAYGTSQNVPVCCFGTEESGDVTKSCAFNDQAYKTSDMLHNCCSFAECETIVLKSNMGQKTEETGAVCQGSFVEFPKTLASKASPDTSPVDTRETETHIPFWVWIVFIVAACFIVLFIMGLAFI